MNPLGVPPPEVVTLEMLRVAAQTRLGAAVLNDLQLESWQDVLMDQLVVQLSSYVQAERLLDTTVSESKDVVLAAPDSTWQMFKSRHTASWWLRWLIRRRPVRYSTIIKTVTLTVNTVGYATFPDSTYVTPSPRLGSPVFQMIRNTHWNTSEKRP